MLALTFGLLIQSTPINVESPGIRMVNLIPKLASEARVSLSVVPSLENDVVAIRTMGRPWGEVKANLAKVLNATWEEKEGRFILTQTSEQQKAERDTLRNIMLTEVTSRLAQIDKYYSPNPWSEQQFTKWFESSQVKLGPEMSRSARSVELVARRRSGVNGRLVARILHGVKPEQLVPADLDWENHRFSTLAAPLHDLIAIDMKSTGSIYLSEWEMVNTRSEEPDLPPKPPFGALFNLWSISRGLVISGTVYDESGNSVTSISDIQRPLPSIQTESLKSKGELTKLVEEVENDVIPQESDTDEEYEKKEKDLSQKRNRLTQLLSDAEQLDPLALFGGDEWIQLGKEKQRPVLSLLADGGSELVSGEHKPTLRGPFRLDDQTWILASQRDAYFVRRSRASRAGIARMYKPRRSNSPIEEIVENLRLTYESGQANLIRFRDLYTSSLFADGVQIESSLTGLVGSLTPDETAGLLAGRRLLVSELGPRTRAYFVKNILVESAVTTDIDPRIPIFAFPNLDQGFFLSAKQKELPGYSMKYIATGPQKTREESMDYDELAVQTARAFSTNVNPSDLPEHFQIASAQKVVLQLSLGYRSKATTTSVMSDWATTGSYRPFKSLDKQFIEGLKKRGEQLIKENDGD
jgi:hypothetical protein